MNNELDKVAAQELTEKELEGVTGGVIGGASSPTSEYKVDNVLSKVSSTLESKSTAPLTTSVPPVPDDIALMTRYALQ